MSEKPKEVTRTMKMTITSDKAVSIGQQAVNTQIDKAQKEKEQKNG